MPGKDIGPRIQLLVVESLFFLNGRALVWQLRDLCFKQLTKGLRFREGGIGSIKIKQDTLRLFDCKQLERVYRLIEIFENFITTCRKWSMICIRRS